MSSVQQLNERIQREGAFLRDVLAEVNRVIVGQDRLVSRLLITLLSGSHALIEGVPGLAKTLAVRTLAATLHARFSRVQFTPDLLPADVIGTQIYNPANGTFVPHRGPVFANIVLADEVNRAPAKVQSALLEAMEERQVTIGDHTYALDEPFMVLATQNPLEQEGTYPLPEAQLDRFMLKILVDYPTRREERSIIDRMAGERPAAATPVVDVQAVRHARDVVRSVYVDDKIKEYVLDIVFATRAPREAKLPELAGLVAVGASPRATLFLVQAAKAHAFLRGRGYVTPDDVKQMAPDVLRHRLTLTFEAEADDVQPDDVVARLLDHVRVP